MLKNYFKTAWRNLWKNKIFSAINIIGLAIGMAACIVILLFVSYERSFDNMHSKNIYRLNEVQKFEGMLASQKVGLSMFPMGPAIKDEFPEVINFTRASWTNKFPLTYGEKTVYFPQMLFVDTSFLQMFDFKMAIGDRTAALQKPNSIVLTHSAATKLFGRENPMGKRIIRINGDTLNFLVTGIMEDVPANSQLQFEGLMSFSTVISPSDIKNWGGNWLDTYFELAPHTDAAAMEKKFPDFLKKHMPGGGWKAYELFLLPLKDVHANASDIGLDYLNFQKFDKRLTGIFSLIALVVLLIACINFMNLSTARSAERAREVGVRKSIGAHRWQLGLQFIGESVLLALLALFLALVMAQLSLPFINQLAQRQLSLPLFSNPLLLLIIVLATIGIGILSGLYPAVYLSSFQASKVLKGSIQTGKSKSLLRNILVVGQFSSAIFLIIATLFVLRQLYFMQHKDPGFDKDQVITFRLDRAAYQKYDLLKQQLLASPLVSSVTASQDQLGSHLDQTGVSFKGDGPVRNLSCTLLIVDPDYLNLYKIKMAEGRNFSPEKSANGKEYIINEALADELLKDTKGGVPASLLGKHFGFDSAGILTGTVVGIAKNFNFNSLQYKVETLFLYNQKDWGFNTVSVKIHNGKASEAISLITTTWNQLVPGHPFEYQFLDDHFREVYLPEQQVSSIITILAVLAIIISGLGLFGLASYAAEKRIKEVGIRKVMGASVQNIVSLLSTQFIKLVLIANLIAWPLAWIAINKWLNGYAYRVEVSWWVFLLSGLAAMIIAIATVSLQAFKAAMNNPIKNLRTE